MHKYTVRVQLADYQSRAFIDPKTISAQSAQAAAEIRFNDFKGDTARCVAILVEGTPSGRAYVFPVETITARGVASQPATFAEHK